MLDPATLEALRRNSGLLLDAEGRFRFRGGAVEHPRVQAMFHAGLSVREDGEVVLAVGQQWAYVACEGVAWFIDRLAAEGERLLIERRGHGRQPCDDPRVGFTADGRAWLWCTPESPPAMLARPAHLALSELLDEGEGGAPRLRLGSQDVPLVELSAPPGPATAWRDARVEAPSGGEHSSSG